MKPTQLLKIKDHEQFLKIVFSKIKDKRTRTALNRLWIETHQRPEAGDNYRRMRMRTWAHVNRAEMYDYKNDRHKKYNFKVHDEKEEWNNSRIGLFVRLQEAGEVDHEIAKRLETTIPMVYYFRRKLKLISEHRPDLVQPRKSIGADSVRKSALLTFMLLGEERLKKALGVRK